MERIYPRLSHRNIEEEVLSELEKLSHISDPAIALQEPNELATDQVKDYHKCSTFSRDFGTFDVTVCTGDDGTQIVLVILEGRVALNGKPIRFLQDGRIADWCNDPDPLLQRYYNIAMNVRAERETGDDWQFVARVVGDCVTSKSDFQMQTGTAAFSRLHDLINLVGERVITLRKENARLKEHKEKSQVWLLKCLGKASSSSPANNIASEDTPLLSELVACKGRLMDCYVVFQKRVDDLERESRALVWTVMSFCREAILRESEKFVHDRYADMYDKYIQAVGREGRIEDKLAHEKEQNLSLELELEQLKKDNTALAENMAKLKIQHGKEEDSCCSNVSQSSEAENKRLREENHHLRVKLAKFKQEKEQDGEMIAKMVVVATEQKKIIERQQADADDAVLIQGNLQQANNVSRTQLQFLENQQASQRLSEERMTMERDTLFRESGYLIEALRKANVERSRLKEKFRKLRVRNRVLKEELEGLRKAPDHLGYDTQSSDDSDSLDSNYYPDDVEV